MSNSNKMFFNLMFILSFTLGASELPPPQDLDDDFMNDAPKDKIIKKAPASKVLNFEADVVEGEKRRPDLFLQSNVEDLSLDNILYVRKDFNDFHAVDSKRRPRHFRFRAKK